MARRKGDLSTSRRLAEVVNGLATSRDAERSDDAIGSIVWRRLLKTCGEREGKDEIDDVFNLHTEVMESIQS